LRHRRSLIVTACLLVYLLLFVRVLTLPVDEGWTLNGAVRILHGETLYRDFFEFHPPATFYWVAMFFRALGETWLASRVCILVTGFATAMLVYYLARRLEPGSEVAALLLWVAASFPAWPTVNPHFVSNLFALAAFALILLWLDRGRPSLLLTAGICAGITAAAMIHKGGLLCLGLAAIVVIRRARIASIAQLAAGTSIVFAAIAVHFASRGALGDLIYAVFLWPLANYSEVGHVPYGFGIQQYLTVGPGAIPALIILTLPASLVALAALRRSAAFNKRTVPYWIAGAAIWISEIHRPDLIHLVLGSPVLIVLASGLSGLRVRQAVTVAAGFAAALNLVIILNARATVTSPVGSMLAFDRNAVLEFTNVRVKPGESIFVYPYSPLYYFLSGASNPTRFSYLLYRHHTNEQMLEVVASLEKDQTRYVIWEYDFETRVAPVLLPVYHAPAQKDRIIEPYLTSHYHEVGSAPGVRFLERNP
jgi:hypothetical protein